MQQKKLFVSNQKLAIADRPTENKPSAPLWKKIKQPGQLVHTSQFMINLVLKSNHTS
jgi:hypothetical protein